MIQADTLKPGWKLVKFGDVVRQVKDKVDPKKSGLERYIAGEHMNTDDLRIRQWGEINDNYLGPAFNMRFKPGQVLYGSRRTYLRKVSVPDFEGICANTTFVLESKNPNVLLPELLPFIMQTEAFHEHSIKQSKGSVNPYINFSDLAWWEFTLQPIEEQKRISKLLSTVEETIKAYTSAYVIVKNTRQSVAHYLFSVDQNSETTKLKQVIEDSRYGPRFSNSLYDDNGELWQLRTTDLDGDGNINYSTIPRVKLVFEQYKEHLLKDGDVVISRSGSCGITAVFRSQNVPIIPAAFLIRLRLNKKMLPEYLNEFFLSPIGQQLTSSLARGGVQKNISGSELLAQNVPNPDLNRQEEVIANLLDLRSTEKQFIERLLFLQEFKKRLVNYVLINAS